MSSDNTYINESRPRSKVDLLHGITWKDSLYKVAEVWEMQDEEEKILGTNDPDMERILVNCLISLGKETPTRSEFQRDIVPNIQLGDWNLLVLKLRCLSLENTYKYRSKCPSCSTVYPFAVDLSEMEVIHAKDPGGTELKYEMRNGKLAIFRPLYVRDQDALATIANDEKDVLKRSLALRLVSIDGEPASLPGDSSRKHIGKAIRLMKNHGLVAMKETEAIRTWFKTEEHEEYEEGDDFYTRRVAVDAKVDAILEDTCPKASCGTTWKHRMEIDPSFMLPSSAE